MPFDVLLLLSASAFLSANFAIISLVSITNPLGIPRLCCPWPPFLQSPREAACCIKLQSPSRRCTMCHQAIVRQKGKDLCPLHQFAPEVRRGGGWGGGSGAGSHGVFLSCVVGSYSRTGIKAGILSSPLPASFRNSLMHSQRKAA